MSASYVFSQLLSLYVYGNSVVSFRVLICESTSNKKMENKDRLLLACRRTRPFSWRFQTSTKGQSSSAGWKEDRLRMKECEEEWGSPLPELRYQVSEVKSAAVRFLSRRCKTMRGRAFPSAFILIVSWRKGSVEGEGFLTVSRPARAWKLCCIRWVS